MIVVWLFLAMPWVCLQFVIVVFPDHNHLLFFFKYIVSMKEKSLLLFLRVLRTKEHVVSTNSKSVKLQSFSTILGIIRYKH